MKKLFSLILLFSLLIFASSPSNALETEWQDSSDKKEGSIRLVSAGYTNPQEITAGLHIKFTDTWKTYWKHPGDSGMSVTPDFSASKNIQFFEMLWPVPTRHLFYDLEGWGYEKEVVLPIGVVVIDPLKDVKLVADVKWAICDENCIFVENKLELNIPPGFKDESILPLIDEYILQAPQQIDSNSNVQLKSLEVSDRSVVAQFTSGAKFLDDVDLFIIEASNNFRFPKPVIERSEDGKTITFTTNYEVLKKDESLKNKELSLTVKNGNAGFETEKKVEKLSAIQVTPESSEIKITMLQAIIAALIGGLILNIMPCVLPVLMLKIFGVLKHGESDKKYIRRSFSFTIAGILFSFLILALFVIAFKALGHTVGWGIQFQHPVFLISMSILLTLFAANQWGIFEINLPTKLSDKLNQKITKAGDTTPLGNFLTGAFATLMATPCTAPYITTAISFAFGADAITMLAVFIFMGVGLALPYILIMISPSLVKIFPKPGRWMSFVKKLLGLLLFITNFWIAYILMASGGPHAASLLIFCLLVLIVWMAVSKKFKLDKRRSLYTVIYIIAVTFIMIFSLAKMEKEPEYMKDVWVKFERPLIDEYVAQGKVVFVDVTADWCLTCKFNKANVVNGMKDYFAAEGVIMMKADYTAPSLEINKYLAENKAYGIPFNKVYGPNAKDGIKLPALLDEKSIKDAVDKAKNNK
jgi:suppressor for copper-sensitivity B